MDAIEAVLGVATDAAKGIVRERYLCVLVNLDVKMPSIRYPGNVSIRPLPE